MHWYVHWYRLNAFGNAAQHEQELEDDEDNPISQEHVEHMLNDVESIFKRAEKSACSALHIHAAGPAADGARNNKAAAGNRLTVDTSMEGLEEKEETAKSVASPLSPDSAFMKEEEKRVDQELRESLQQLHKVSNRLLIGSKKKGGKLTVETLEAVLAAFQASITSAKADHQSLERQQSARGGCSLWHAHTVC
jgi:hypothetical protein